MNHTAICIRLQIYVRENRNDEERNQEGCKKGREKGPSQKEEVTEPLTLVSCSKQKCRLRFSEAIFFCCLQKQKALTEASALPDSALALFYGSV
jgi:hypothetical protein